MSMHLSGIRLSDLIFPSFPLVFFLRGKVQGVSYNRVESRVTVVTLF